MMNPNDFSLLYLNKICAHLFYYQKFFVWPSDHVFLHEGDRRALMKKIV